MMRRRARSGEDEGLEVDLSPLIDVTFLLLIFFVLTTSFQRDNQIEIDRPEASTSSPVFGEPVRVTLDAEGVTYLDGRRVEPWLLQRRVGARLADAPNRNVLLIADERAPSGRTVEVLDQCRLAGAEDVALATRRSGP